MEITSICSHATLNTCPSHLLGGFSFVLYVAFIIPCFGLFMFSEREGGLYSTLQEHAGGFLGMREINYNSLKLLTCLGEFALLHNAFFSSYLYNE